MLPEGYAKRGATVFFPRDSSVMKLPKPYEIFEVQTGIRNFNGGNGPDTVVVQYIRVREIDLRDGSPTGPYMTLDPYFCMSFAQGMAGLADRKAQTEKRIARMRGHLMQVEAYAQACQGYMVERFNGGVSPNPGPYRV